MQQEMMWWQWRDASAGPVNRLHLTADRQPRQSPPPYHSIFYWPDALPDAQPTVSNTIMNTYVILLLGNRKGILSV